MTTIPIINVAKIATCNSLSGSATLTYHLAYAAESKDQIFIRVVESGGPGVFNTCWWPLEDIEQALTGIAAEAAFTISALKSVFAGRSVNTMYFVLAALLDCGLLKRAVNPEDGYVRNTPKELLTELQTLIEAGVNLVPDAMGQADGHSQSRTKASAPRKKQSGSTTATA